MTVTVVLVGGLSHGTVLEIPAMLPPRELKFPVLRDGRLMEAVYVRRELADTPGRIAYTYEGDR